MQLQTEVDKQEHACMFLSNFCIKQKVSSCFIKPKSRLSVVTDYVITFLLMRPKPCIHSYTNIEFQCVSKS